MNTSLGMAVVSAVILLLCVAAPVVASSPDASAQSDKKYKFLYFAFEKLGSHGMQVSQSGKVLARQGHEVTFLLGSDGPRKPKVNDEDLFSFVFFKSRYTEEDKLEMMRKLSRVTLNGGMDSYWGIAKLIFQATVTGKPLMIHTMIDECEDLLVDSETIDRLRRQNFDMMVVDDLTLCGTILAEVLDIPFVESSTFPHKPEVYETLFEVPANPSYIPGTLLHHTDRMTFFQRLVNVILHWNIWIMTRGQFIPYQNLKIKYNIKPEVHITESLRKAKFWTFNSNYPLEFPRPMHPNTIIAPVAVGGKRPIKKVADDVAEFIDTAPVGVVMFSFGTHVESMEREQAQMFADGFAMVPQRVLWQTSADLSSIAIGKNTKVVKWLPLAQLMERPNIKALVTHGGVNCVNEAMWAGLPMIGIPIICDTYDNIDRVVYRGFGVYLDIKTLTSTGLRDAISMVVNDPKYRENAKRASAIMRDILAIAPPAETVAHWILHVTKFGDDHLRPAVFDLNFFQKNLLDVYLVFLLVTTGVVGINVYLCYMCCLKRRGHAKRD